MHKRNTKESVGQKNAARKLLSPASARLGNLREFLEAEELLYRAFRGLRSPNSRVEEALRRVHRDSNRPKKDH